MIIRKLLYMIKGMKSAERKRFIYIKKYSKISRNRVLVTVLRESLLKQLDNGAFEPKKLKREKVKEVLLSFRRNLQKNARSECIESRLTTFDYI